MRISDWSSDVCSSDLKNVAGIEIENCIGADVYDNVTTGNTGGILVFNMPDLPQPGHTTRVFNNRIVANNHDNFGRAGTAVAAVRSEEHQSELQSLLRLSYAVFCLKNTNLNQLGSY